MNLNPFRHKDLPSLGNVEREVVDEFRRLETFTESLILQLASWTASDIAYDPTSDPLTAETDVQAAMEDHAAAIDGHIGVGGTSEHPVFTTSAAGFAPNTTTVAGRFLGDDGTWQYHKGNGGTSEHPVFTTSLAGFAPATGFLPVPSAYFLAANGSWIGHRTVGGTSEHPVFTTSVPGFVPAPSTSTGKFLLDSATWVAHRAVGGTSEHPVFTTSAAGFVPASTSTTGKVLYDSGWGAAPSSPIFGWGETILSGSNFDFNGSSTAYQLLDNSNFAAGGVLQNVSRFQGRLAPTNMSGKTIRCRATAHINFNLGYDSGSGTVNVDTLLYVRFYNLATAAQFGSAELITILGPDSEKQQHFLTISAVGTVSNGQYIGVQFKWTTTGGGSVGYNLRINPAIISIEPVGE